MDFICELVDEVMAKLLGFKDSRATLKIIGFFLGLINIYAIGFLNAVYSDLRWPTSSGVQFLIDMFHISFTNPYAILSGVLVYLFFYRTAERLAEIQKGKIDLIWVGLASSILILVLLLVEGRIVY